MSYKTKANIFGTIAIICEILATVISIIPIYFYIFGISKFIAVIVLMLMTIYTMCRDSYKIYRMKEIDEELKNNLTKQ